MSRYLVTMDAGDSHIMYLSDCDIDGHFLFCITSSRAMWFDDEASAAAFCDARAAQQRMERGVYGVLSEEDYVARILATGGNTR